MKARPPAFLKTGREVYGWYKDFSVNGVPENYIKRPKVDVKKDIKNEMSLLVEDLTEDLTYFKERSETIACVLQDTLIKLNRLLGK